MTERRDEEFPDCTFEGTRRWQRERDRELSATEKIRWLQDTMAEIGPWVGAARQGADDEPSGVTPSPSSPGRKR